MPSIVNSAYTVDFQDVYIKKHDRNYFRFYSFAEMGGIVKMQVTPNQGATRIFQFKVRCPEVIVDINDYFEFPQYAGTFLLHRVVFFYNDESISSWTFMAIMGKTFELPEVYSQTCKIVTINGGELTIFSKSQGFLITPSGYRVSIVRGYTTIKSTDHPRLFEEDFAFTDTTSQVFDSSISYDSRRFFRYIIRKVCRHKADSLVISFIDRFGLRRYEECFLTSSTSSMESIGYTIRNSYAVKDFPANVVTSFGKEILLTLPKVTKELQIEDILLCEDVRLHLINGNSSYISILPADGELEVGNEPQDVSLKFKIIS